MHFVAHFTVGVSASTTMTMQIGHPYPLFQVFTIGISYCFKFSWSIRSGCLLVMDNKTRINLGVVILGAAILSRWHSCGRLCSWGGDTIHPECSSWENGASYWEKGSLYPVRERILPVCFLLYILIQMSPMLLRRWYILLDVLFCFLFCSAEIITGGAKGPPDKVKAILNLQGPFGSAEISETRIGRVSIYIHHNFEWLA